MSEEKTYTATQAHKYFAVETNKLVWQYLSKTDRTREDDLRMTHLAHASLYHWLEIGTMANRTRGEWLASRVYTVTNQPILALAYAQDCLKTCQENGIGDLDLIYAYEAMARANAANGNLAETKNYFALASEAGKAIANDKDRQIFESDLASEPWFGFKSA
jgi:hypothetical protein